MSRPYHEKIAVFDLDGTLWIENSHMDILNQFYHTKRYNGLLSRMVNRFFPWLYLRHLYSRYERISSEFIDQYKPRFLDKSMDLVASCARESYFVIIISNAPEEIVMNAANRLSLPYLRTDQANKYRELQKNYEYKELLVCTDNLSDTDLLIHADTRIIYTQPSTERYFKRRFPEAIFYRKEELR